MHEFEFDGTKSSSYNVMISGTGTFNSTERDVSVVEVPGRDGNLIIDNGRYRNISLTYPCFFTNQSDFISFRANMMSKRGYKVLKDTYHPTEFRMARFTGNISPSTTQYNKEGEFSITFDCKPQRFLLTGDAWNEFTTDDSITNPTLFDSKPLIRVYGSGTLGVGDYSITVDSNNYPYIDIDCDTMNAFYDATNCNSLITGAFPVLHAGANGILIDTFTQVDIKGRWFTL